MQRAAQAAGQKSARRDLTKAPFGPNFCAIPSLSNQLFVHCLSPLPGLRDLTGQLPGLERYAERALLLAEEGDVVCVAHAVPVAYLRYLQGLGLGPAPSHVVTVPAMGAERQSDPLVVRLLQQTSCLRRVAGLLHNDREAWLNCFVSSDADVLLQCRLASAIHKPVHIVNSHPGRLLKLHDKQFVRQKALELGMPMPPGEVVRLAPGEAASSELPRSLRRAVEKYATVCGRAIVRGTQGTSGSSAFVITLQEESTWHRLQTYCRNRPDAVFLVESYYELEASPNVSMFIDPRTGDITCLSVSDQLLDPQLRHLGNRYPSRATLVDQMVAAAQRFCVWLRERRITGHQGFDFCEYRESATGQRKMFFAELNPRVTGAAYPAQLLNRFNSLQSAESDLSSWHAFRSMIVPTTISSFDEFEAAYADLLFGPHKAAGLIPYNIGLLRHGKLMFVIVGRMEADVEAIYEQFLEQRIVREPQLRREPRSWQAA